MVSMQAYMYVRVCRKDYWMIRLLVRRVLNDITTQELNTIECLGGFYMVCYDYWLSPRHLNRLRLLDIFHTAMVGTSLWSYLILHFGDNPIHDTIFW